MKKFYFTIFLLGMLLICTVLLFTGCTADKEGDLRMFSFTLQEDDTYHVALKKKYDSVTQVVIPATYRGKPVTGIDDYAFQCCRSLTSVTIPDSVTYIGDVAFQFCSSLASITIPAGVTSIGNHTFECCDFESLTLPDGVTSIGCWAITGCRKLTRIDIPDSVTRIDELAFYGCESLETIVLPDSVTSIGEYAFSECSSLEYITIPAGVTCIEKETFSKCDSLIGVTVTNGVTDIGKSAFLYCRSLTDIRLPDSLIGIGERAFEGCESLASIILPDSVTTLGGRAFGDCSSLAFNEYDNGLYLGNESNPYRVLVEAKDYDMISCEIQESTKQIGVAAFQYRERLTRIVIPNGVTSIDTAAFFRCSSLKSMVIPARATLPTLHPQNNYCTL